MAAKSFSWNEYMRAWNTGNVDAILDCYAEDCEVIGTAPAPLRGKDQVRKNVQTFFKAFSDVNGDAQVLLAQGEYVGALLNVTSKHTGPLDVGGGKTIPATNKKVEDKLAVFLQLDENGKIAREWDVTNQLATFQQLGVEPPRAPLPG
jgi:steroid delta-isomerase-like uncharacterized protein